VRGWCRQAFRNAAQSYILPARPMKYLNVWFDLLPFFSWRVALNPSGVSSETNTQRQQSHPPGDQGQNIFCPYTTLFSDSDSFLYFQIV
jgi:hypothetical protein